MNTRFYSRVCHQPAGNLEKKNAIKLLISERSIWIRDIPPSAHSARICEVRADLSRSSKSRKGPIIRHGSPAASFTKTDGKSPGILDIPPHPPSSNAGNLVHYLQQTQWDHFLNETPLQSQILSQRLSFQALPPSPHSSHFLPLPQSGIKIQSFHQQHAISKAPKCEESTMNLESIWQEILSFLASCSRRLRPTEQNGLFHEVL